MAEWLRRMPRKHVGSPAQVQILLLSLYVLHYALEFLLNNLILILYNYFIIQFFLKLTTVVFCYYKSFLQPFMHNLVREMENVIQNPV
jgi:hypothetical protein